MSATEPWRNPRPAPDLDELRHRGAPKSWIPAWLRAWWPALLWSLVIFSASTDTFSSNNTTLILEPVLRWIFPAITPNQFETIHVIVRKSAHFGEYCVFFLLVYRGIRGARPGWNWSWGLFAWLIAAGYSALDEIHQIFVASRTASVWDSLLDSTGACFALIALFLWYKLRRPRVS